MRHTSNSSLNLIRYRASRRKRLTGALRKALWVFLKELPVYLTIAGFWLLFLWQYATLTPEQFPPSSEYDYFEEVQP